MGWFSTPVKEKTNWIDLTSPDQLEESKGIRLYFKHSRRCATSIMALKQFERQWEEREDCPIYFLDLLKHRDISNEIELISGVKHESPQVIVMDGEDVIYCASHVDIDANDIRKALKGRK